MVSSSLQVRLQCASRPRGRLSLSKSSSSNARSALRRVVLLQSKDTEDEGGEGQVEQQSGVPNDPDFVTKSSRDLVSKVFGKDIVEEPERDFITDLVGKIFGDEVLDDPEPKGFGFGLGKINFEGEGKSEEKDKQKDTRRGGGEDVPQESPLKDVQDFFGNLFPKDK